MVLAPEHPLTAAVTRPERRAEVEAFVARMKKTEAVERTGEGAPKEGVFTGAHAVNPFTGEAVPVWIANFVLAEYGTGAVMSVPAHDQRDFEFARKYGLPIRTVIQPAAGERTPAGDRLAAATTGDGVTEGSGAVLRPAPRPTARERMSAHAAAAGFGGATVRWHLRDWGFSRQRYWGTPIPIVYCDTHGAVPVPLDQLPVKLPPQAIITGTGEPPLAKVPEFVNTTCPTCGGPARRETETMDTFVDSAWYYARYLSPRDDTQPFDPALAKRWLPVDVYVGGPEHAVMHLLYFRFWHRVMHELGLTAEPEPCKRLVTQGIVNGPDGRKMSKRWNNVVAPGYMVDRFGADTVRLFMLFAAPPEKDIDWSDEQVDGLFRFLTRGLAALPRRGRPASAPRRGGAGAGGRPVPRAAPPHPPDHQEGHRGDAGRPQVQHRHRRAHGADERAAGAGAEGRARAGGGARGAGGDGRRCWPRSRPMSPRSSGTRCSGRRRGTGCWPRSPGRRSTRRSSWPTPSPSRCR